MFIGGARRLPYYSTRPAEFAATLSRHWQHWRSAEDAPPADCAFVLGGGLGDQLIAARYLRDLIEHCGPMTFDAYGSSPALTAFALNGVTGHRDSLAHEKLYWSKRNYIAVFDVSAFVRLRRIAHPIFPHAPTRQLISQLRALVSETTAFTHSIHNYANMVTNHPYLDNLLAQTTAAMGYKRHNFCHAMSGIPYGGDLLNLPNAPDSLHRFGLAGRQYVTIADGYDRASQQVQDAQRSTKSYPHYDALVAELKKRIPGLYIVQVGKSTGRPIAGTDKVLVDKTSLPELATVLSASQFHIDNEGGLVHLATSLGTRCCVLFGPTNLSYFSYDQNINVEPAACGNCFWTTHDWMTRCPRGDDIPVCMREISPRHLSDRIAPEILQQMPPLPH